MLLQTEGFIESTTKGMIATVDCDILAWKCIQQLLNMEVDCGCGIICDWQLWYRNLFEITKVTCIGDGVVVLILLKQQSAWKFES